MHGALARACGVSLQILMIVYIECLIGETIDEDHLDYSLCSCVHPAELRLHCLLVLI